MILNRIYDIYTWFPFIQGIFTTQNTIFVFYAPSIILRYSNFRKIMKIYPISKISREKSIACIGDNKTTLKKYLHEYVA